MKKIFLLFLLVLSHFGFSQDTTYSSENLEKQPEFPGGIKEFGSYVQRHYKYPNVRLLKGKVFVEFVIDKNGKVVDIKVTRDIGFGTGEEAIRLLENCPNWSPGYINGEPVRVRYMMPISIDLD